ncbi:MULTISPECIES: DUF5994 family protein [unclassified Mycobacterium]|uniref:DUF5994 family protein n=1 Tax=unclassified Mycobacterium TaxID=2642494 RepID=UPI0029C8BE84|nr:MULTISPECIES: DUF5994 family protein [unclassified Mycobacterium]
MTLEETSDQHQFGLSPRLSLAPANRSLDEVGGAWWPRSRNLTAELPDLVAALAVRVGRVERVVYDPAGWDEAPERIVIGDATVTLDAYRYESFHKLYAYGIDGTSIVLRIVPTVTNDAAALTLMDVGATELASTGGQDKANG